MTIPEITYETRLDGSILIKPNMDLVVAEVNFTATNNFVSKSGYYFDDSIFEVIELEDGNTDIVFKSFRSKNNGNIMFKNILGQFHNLNRPSVEREDGSLFWHKNGKFHRKDGPAIEHIDGYKAWFINGKRHRIDGPAIIFPYEVSFWYKNGYAWKDCFNALIDYEKSLY